MLAGMLAVTPITVNAEEYEVMAEEEVFNVEEDLESKGIVEPEEVLESEGVQEIEEVLEPEGDLETEGVLEPEVASETEETVESEGTMEPEETVESDGIAETEEVLETEVDVADQDTELMSEENEEIESNLTEKNSDEFDESDVEEEDILDEEGTKSFDDLEQMWADTEEFVIQSGDAKIIASGTLDDEDITWSVDENKVMRIEGIGEVSNSNDNDFQSILIEYEPETIIIGKGITYVYLSGDEWKYQGIKTVIMSDTVTDFELGGCVNLESVTLSKNIKEIPKYEFYGCKNLVNVNLPNGLNRINAGAFQSCTSLKEITIPDTVTLYGDNIFEGCESLEKVRLSKNAKAISCDMFKNCKNLKDIIIPEGVTSIDDSFDKAKITGTLKIPRSMEFIYIYPEVDGDILVPCHLALDWYSEVYLKEGCTYYHEGGVTDFDEDNCSVCVRTGSCGDDTTYKMTLHGKTTISGRGEINDISYQIREEITELIIENGIYRIDSYLFQGAKNLRTLEIADSVKEIGEYAFSRCSKLETAKIGKNLKTDIEEVFYGDISLKTFIISQENSYYAVMDGVVFSKDLTQLLYFPANREGEEYRIPENVMKIGTCAINYNQNLKKIVFPKNIVISDDNGFDLIGSTKLEAVEIYGNWTHIPGKFLSDCVSIKKITIPESITSIGHYAFSGCESLEEITIPKTVSYIGESAFKGCKMLKKIILPKKIYNIYTNTFLGCSSLSEIHYLGTIDEWKKIDIEEGNYYLDDVTLHTYSCIEEIKADCENDGKRTYKCDICEDNYIETVSATGHTEVIDSAETATCTKEGKTEGSHCATCGKVFHKQRIVKAIGHKWDSGNIIKNATCTEVGETRYCCLNCGQNKTETVPATGHSWKRYYTIDKESTCAASGSKSVHCRNCNAKNKVTALSKKPHTYKSVVTKATTKKNGKIVKKCEKCGYTGSSTVISYPKTITLSKTNTACNGKVQKPSILVKSADGKKIASSNYTVKYSGGYKNVGTYTITITFKGNYSGNVSKTYTILPKGTAISQVAPVSKGFDVKWKKQNVQTTGYQIQYAANNKFTGAKTITVSKNATVSKKVTKLSANKKYYIRIRTYKTAGNKKYYSSWSAAKSVTTKK